MRAMVIGALLFAFAGCGEEPAKRPVKPAATPAAKEVV